MKKITERGCRDSKTIISFAKAHGVDVREGKGSHFVMRKDSNVEVCYHGDVSDGVAKKIFKFFLKIGLISLVLYVIYFQLFA